MSGKPWNSRNKKKPGILNNLYMLSSEISILHKKSIIQLKFFVVIKIF